MTKSFLNVKREFYGLQIPVQFKLYAAYESNVRSDFTIILANPAYRQKLGVNLPTDYFDTVGTEKLAAVNAEQKKQDQPFVE